MKTYSIEFAHIYVDEKINGNHFDSVDVLEDLKKATPHSFTSIVLIDDYNASSKTFNTKEFLRALEDKGVKPDFYAYESELIPFADILLRAIEKPKIARMQLSYIARKGKYPCSLLTAAWYLVRLGRIDGKSIIRINNPTLKAADAVSNQLINILPGSFKEIEKDAHKLIGQTTFKEDGPRIKSVLFKEKHPVRHGFVPERVMPS